MAYTKEGLPTRPGGLDGAVTDGVSDGAWTEEYVQGAYTWIGWEKEIKPFTRFTHTNESVPSDENVGSSDGIGILAESGFIGMVADSGEEGIPSSYTGRTLEAQLTWVGTDESVPSYSAITEDKPTV